MVEGILVEALEFPYNDFKHVLAFFVVAHDEGTNMLTKTSVLNMADLAKEFKKTMQGGKWEDAMKALEQATGKRTFSWRCVVVAQTLPDSVLEKIDEYEIPTSWIVDNKYFTGQGANCKRLSEAGRLALGGTWGPYRYEIFDRIFMQSHIMIF